MKISRNLSKPKIHPLADVQSAMIGEGTTIWQFCVVLKGAKIGKNCNLNAHVLLENDVLIGNNVTVKPGVQIWDGTTLEDDVFIGPNATFTNDLMPRSKQYPNYSPKTLVKKGASIGANSTILCGLTIAEYTIVGIGSVVTSDTLPYSLMVGNPARLKNFVCRCGQMMINKKMDGTLLTFGCVKCNNRMNINFEIEEM